MSERHRRLKELFAAACERPAAEREAFLDEVCGSDHELRCEILSLLKYDYPGALDLDARNPNFPGTPDCCFPPGTILAERYRIVGMLGLGGMADIYRAEDLRLGQTVALKFLPESVRNDPARLELLRDEVRIARTIGHPNVCRVYDFGEASGAGFLSMEFIDGEDLGSLLRRVGRLPLDRARAIGLDLCAGLIAVHGQGILHRDLKPANVMIDGDGRVRLADFGMAAVAGADAGGGTPAYMAPEHKAGEASVQSDLYALGLVLYELFTGQPTFEARSLSELQRLHREVPPRPPGELVEGLPAATEQMILQCLEKDARDRPTSARVVAAALAAEEMGMGARPATPPAAELRATPPRHNRISPEAARLRRWPPPDLPARPYPVLLPYTHPALLAGRDRELRELQRRLRLPLPILGLYAVSGTGKSSLLAAGLVPALRDAGVPVALVRQPQEPALARRLVGDLLESPITDDEEACLVASLYEAAHLAGRAPVLVVDQLENLLRAAEARNRARLGILLAATVQRRPGTNQPWCRWVLAYRQEYHGEVTNWLGDVLDEARTAGLSYPAGLPHDLATSDRFHAMKISPLGTSPRTGPEAADATAEALEEAARIFREVIGKPLELTDPDGAPRYGWRFADDGAERLAMAFAEARISRPSAPLTPDLQIVLAHLLATSGPDDLVKVPENPSLLIDEALEDHVRRALEAAFPASGPERSRAALSRARALLALRELATSGDRNEEGIAAEDVARAIAPRGRIGDGQEILEKLATPLTRLVVLHEHADGFHYALAHDWLAEVVVRMVEREGRQGKLIVDGDLLALRRFVAVKTALYHSRSSAGEATVATRIPRRHYRRIRAHAEALLWNNEQRAWWEACRERRRADRRRSTTLTAAVLLCLLVVTWGTWSWVRKHRAHQALLDQVVEGEPGVALRALDQLARGPEKTGTSAQELLALLRRREVPMDVLEQGLGEIPGESLSAVVLKAATIALPWVAETPEDPVLIANLVWALDYGPGRDRSRAAEARALRDRVLDRLRTIRPPPAIPDHHPDWVRIPAGSFRMGSPEGEGEGDEHPQHEVMVSAFRILRHEVTNADYRQFVPDHSGEDHLPAESMTWHDAYTYAAWLGGRLPTEAEWEYAARAGCPYAYCTQNGRETSVDAVAWTLRLSRDPETHELVPSPVMQLEPNPWGLYDMLGNLWEWTADWYAAYRDETLPVADPWGPAAGSWRVDRGGCYADVAAWSRVASRSTGSPGNGLRNLGFRVLLPGSPSF